MTRTKTITKNEAINLMLRHKMNKFYAGTLAITDILERCDCLNFDNIKPCYTLAEIHSDYLCIECEYENELCRLYTRHTLIKHAIVQGFVTLIFIFENDQRVVYVMR